MKVKTFWLILLKIFGIFLVLRGANVILNFLSLYTMTTFRYVEDGEYLGLVLQIVASTLLIAIIYFFILWLFVFKTSWLIKKLRLEKGFEDERIDLNISLSNILSIAIIVMGGIMIIDSLPQLSKQIFYFYQQKIVLREDPAIGWIILYFSETILGFILMTNSKQITRFINKRASDDEKCENETKE